MRRAYSSKLRVTILIARNMMEAANNCHIGEAIYTEAEVQLLKGTHEDDLRRIHKIKQLFGGHVYEILQQ